MTPERWKRIEELYHAARARPPADRAAFLAEACSDDEAMRRNVESLLAESESDDGFLAEPALAMSARSGHRPRPRDHDRARRLAGISCRRCSARAAWARCTRAHDPKLGRDVAIKILPPCVHEPSGSSRALRARSADARRAESPQHLRDLRLRRSGWRSLPDSRARRGRRRSRTRSRTRRVCTRTARGCHSVSVWAIARQIAEASKSRTTKESSTAT